MAEFTEMLGTPAPQQPPQGQPGMHAGMQDPEAGKFMASISKPAQSAEEFQQRQGMWTELVNKVNTNPQLRQAMLMMGVQMAQPVAPGQTPFGHVAAAVGTGAAAYNAGEYQQYQQDAAGRKEGRETAESQARIKASEAGTRQTQAQAQILERTAQLRIDQMRIQLDRDTLALDKAKSEEEVAGIERQLQKRRGNLALEIPDEKVRQGMEAEIDTALEKVKEARARTDATKATADLTRAKTDREKKEIEAIPNDPEKARQYFTKSGPYANTATSGIVQQGEFWGKIYDKLPMDDASRKGKTREQYMASQLKTSNEKSLMETYTKMLGLADFDDPILKDLREMIQAQTAARKGQAAPRAKEDDKDLKWTSFGAGTHERAARADGTVIIRKKAGGSPGVRPIQDASP